MPFVTRATTSAGVLRDLAEHELTRRRAAGLTTAGAGVTKPLALDTINNIDDYFAITGQIYQDNLRQKGGTAGDTNATPLGDNYAARRYEFIKGGEALREWAYDDKTSLPVVPGRAKQGNTTVGIGFNMERPDARDVWKNAGVSEDFQAVYEGRQRLSSSSIRRLFDYNAAEAESVVNERVGKTPLPEHKRLALVSMAFNGPVLLGKALISAVTSGDDQGALNTILHGSNRKRIKGLANRRYKEAAMFAGPTRAPHVLPDYREYIKDFA